MKVSSRMSLFILLLISLTVPNTLHAVEFQQGDVFASLSNGNVAHYTSTGVLKAVYNVAGEDPPPPGGEISAGMAFDTAGNLYVTRYSAFKLAKLDNTGNLLNNNLASGLYAPQSVAIDRSGNLYVGNLYVGLRKYDASDGFLGTITPDRIEFFDLSADESTIFYGDLSDVRRVSNTIPGTPGADFASGLFPRVFGMRVRTNGEWLLANQTDIKRVSPTGSVMAAYDAPDEDNWFALNLDPDGLTFWAASYSGSQIYRFDIGTGQIVTKFNTGDIKVGGLAIFDRAVPTPPAAPSGAAAAAVSTLEISVHWTDNSNTETGFNIERCSSQGCYEIFVQYNVTSYLDSGLTSGTTYSYRVRAQNSAGSSDWSNTEAATTLTAPAPAPPSLLTATAVSTSQINLTWADNSTNESGFQIERCTGAGCTTFAQITSVGANVASYANTGLTPNTAHSYRVRAFDGPSASDYSNTVTSTTQPSAPAAPSALTATAVSTSQINLTWTDNASTESGFRIERCQGEGCDDFSQIAAVGANVLAFSNTGLGSGSQYTYRVYAHNASGNSVYSNTAAARTAGSGGNNQGGGGGNN